MMRINTENIKSLSPCESGLKPWLQYYGESDLSLKEVLSLEHIEAKDKVWLAVRILLREQLIKFANNCASRAKTYAANATTYATYAAVDADFAERNLQILDLINLCSEIEESV